MSSRSKDIIFLLGAGASAEAGIPTSAEMIHKIDQLLTVNGKWRRFRDLYHHVKSAIYYSAGLRGRFNSQVSYNMETLVNTLYELEKNEDHPLYPFIATWNSRFVALAGPDFGGVRQFRHLILEALKKWMCPEDSAQADYYYGLATLQKDLNFPLPVFSLNYDLCVERLGNQDFRVETGFGGFGSRHVWDWERFEDTGPNPLPQIVLFKLHGSINWKREEATKQLFSVEQVENIDPDRMEVIFGRDFKLEAADPYLFYAYEFRRYALIAKLIVVVGYGFGDPHINKMLTQGLRDDPNRHIFVIRKQEGNGDDLAREIHTQLELSEAERGQVVVRPETAKEFLETPNLAELLRQKIPKGADAPF
ncbi:MAG: SIR2 family protein [Gammaproteobacteria bacterium]